MKITKTACEALEMSYLKGNKEKVFEFIKELKPIQAAYVAVFITDSLKGYNSGHDVDFFKSLEVFNKEIE